MYVVANLNCVEYFLEIIIWDYKLYIYIPNIFIIIKFYIIIIIILNNI